MQHNENDCETPLDINQGNFTVHSFVNRKHICEESQNLISWLQGKISVAPQRNPSKIQNTSTKFFFSLKSTSRTSVISLCQQSTIKHVNMSTALQMRRRVKCTMAFSTNYVETKIKELFFHVDRQVRFLFIITKKIKYKRFMLA